MVDAARQMLDELMGRNRNLHPSEAGAKVNWEDPEFCQFYNVKFCPHDLFINTRADLGPCARIHDEEAKHLYEEARPSQRKRQYEDEFLRFCNVMLHDVDRKIQKGKQRLQLMQRDQPVVPAPLSRHQEQLANLTARINKLLSEAEEAGIRGDVDQAQDLMTLCDELKEEKEQLVRQFEASQKTSLQLQQPQSSGDEQQPPQPLPCSPGASSSDGGPPANEEAHSQTQSTAASAGSDEAPEAVATSSAPDSGSSIAEEGGEGAATTPAAAATATPSGEEKTEAKTAGWSHETLPEKQMKVCEICGAFLIVGDAQQRIEDHLMGKQHLGYSKLRNAVAEINEARQKEREQEDRRRREGRVQRFHTYDNRRDSRNDYRERSRDYGQNRQPSDRRHHHHKSHHGSHHSYSRSGGGSGGGGVGGGNQGGGGGNRNNRHHNHNHNHGHYRHDSRERHCRSRSRSRY